jgi:hypothetical protein
MLCGETAHGLGLGAIPGEIDRTRLQTEVLYFDALKAFRARSVNRPFEESSHIPPWAGVVLHKRSGWC